MNSKSESAKELQKKAELDAGFQTQQEERYVISLFLLLLGDVSLHSFAGRSPSLRER